jgi:hypothetical protein
LAARGLRRLRRYNGDPLRVYQVDAYAGHENWFWGVSFQLTGRKSYRHVTTLEEAKAAFKAEYERWQREEDA